MTRITVRLSDALYDRLALFAQGRRHDGQTPELAPIIREALEQYLTPQRDSWLTRGRHLAATEGDSRGRPSPKRA
jgi:predicted transcriptional regulator